MNTVIRFDRNEIFTNVVDIKDVHNVITDVQSFQFASGQYDFDFINYLFGLFDGYLYTNLLTIAMEYPSDIYERVLDIYRTISDSV